MSAAHAACAGCKKCTKARAKEAKARKQSGSGGILITIAIVAAIAYGADAHEHLGATNQSSSTEQWGNHQ